MKFIHWFGRTSDKWWTEKPSWSFSLGKLNIFNVSSFYFTPPPGKLIKNSLFFNKILSHCILQFFFFLAQECWFTLTSLHLIGNDVIHELTKNKPKLRVDLERFSGQKGHGEYSSFVVENENRKYRMTASGFSGSIGEFCDVNKCSCFAVSHYNHPTSKHYNLTVQHHFLLRQHIIWQVNIIIKQVDLIIWMIIFFKQGTFFLSCVISWLAYRYLYLKYTCAWSFWTIKHKMAEIKQTQKNQNK